MEEKINRLYSDFHAQKLGAHCYPNEFLVRTMLGKYPELKISHEYQGKKVLDWACGDGRNNKVPFADNSFDYIVASSSIYYVDHNSNFNENYDELCRVLKTGGYIIMTLSRSDNFILKDCVKWQDKEGHYQITNDPYGLRNGDIFRVWQNEEEIRETFSKDFGDICIGKTVEDYYGMHIALWLVVMRKI